MKSTYKFALFLLLVVIVSCIGFTDANAQCAMCQAVPQTSQAAGSSVADGLNKGIMYILLTPYLVIGTVGFFWWRARKKAQTA